MKKIKKIYIVSFIMILLVFLNGYLINYLVSFDYKMDNVKYVEKNNILYIDDQNYNMSYCLPKGWTGYISDDEKWDVVYYNPIKQSYLRLGRTKEKGNHKLPYSIANYARQKIRVTEEKDISKIVKKINYGNQLDRQTYNADFVVSVYFSYSSLDDANIVFYEHILGLKKGVYVYYISHISKNDVDQDSVKTIFNNLRFY